MKKLVAVITVVFLLLGCTKKAMKFEEKKIIPDTKLTDVFNRAKKYRGKSVKLTGQINNVETGEKGVTIQVWQKHYTNIPETFIAFVDHKSEDFKRDDYVEVKGIVQWEFEGKTLSGEVKKSPTIKVHSIKKKTITEAYAPTIKSLEVNELKVKNEVEIKVEKIEFATKETRVYLRVKNSRKSMVNLYQSNTKALHKGKEYGSLGAIPYNFPKIKSDIAFNEVAHGIVMLEPIKTKGEKFKLQIGVFTTNPTQAIAFNFNIKLK